MCVHWYCTVEGWRYGGVAHAYDAQTSCGSKPVPLLEGLWVPESPSNRRQICVTGEELSFLFHSGVLSLLIRCLRPWSYFLLAILGWAGYPDPRSPQSTNCEVPQCLVVLRQALKIPMLLQGLSPATA